MGNLLLKVVLVAQWFLIHQKVSATFCNYYQELIFGQEYIISNLEYPNNYSSGIECFWDLRTVVGTKIYLSCNDVNLPLSTNCNEDALAVSWTGNKNLQDAELHCGKASFSKISQASALTVGLRSTSQSQGGNFFCTATAIVDTGTVSSLQTRSDIACDCGWKPMSRIVGGQDAKVHEFPFMSALILRGQLWCGANIISDRFVLTAGHCVLRQNVANLLLLAGDHNINTGNDTQYSALYNINAYEIHPNYNERTQRNDIAIIQTSTVIIFSPNIGPICLPFRYTAQDFSGQTVQILGWGQKEFTGPLSNILQKADVSVITNQQCSTMQSETITNGEICTYSAQGKDSCQSDSGGPVVWNDPSTNRYQLVGITSRGVGCGAASPSINTRVTLYLQWIVTRTGVGFCVI